MLHVKSTRYGCLLIVLLALAWPVAAVVAAPTMAAAAMAGTTEMATEPAQ